MSTNPLRRPSQRASWFRTSRIGGLEESKRSFALNLTKLMGRNLPAFVLGPTWPNFSIIQSQIVRAGFNRERKSTLLQVSDEWKCFRGWQMDNVTTDVPIQGSFCSFITETKLKLRVYWGELFAWPFLTYLCFRHSRLTISIAPNSILEGRDFKNVSYKALFPVLTSGCSSVSTSAWNWIKKKTF